MVGANKIDILSYVTSDAIRNYLKEIDYKFSTPEAAFLVHRNPTVTVEEKNKALQKIIDTMPDGFMRVPGISKDPVSIHELLKKYIDIRKRALEVFYDEEQAVYSYVCACREGTNEMGQYNLYYRDPDNRKDKIFPNFAACRKNLSDTIREFDILFSKEREDDDAGSSDGGIYCITVNRYDLSNPDNQIVVMMNRDTEILDIEEYGELLSDEDWDIIIAFDDMWFNLPVPFKKGDILCKSAYFGKSEYAAKRENVPFVLDRLYDKSEMWYCGYYIDKEKTPTKICFDDGWMYGFDYYTLEYYTGELTGAYRSLKSLSSFLKGESSLDTLLDALFIVTNEETIKVLSENISYMKEWLRCNKIVI